MSRVTVPRSSLVFATGLALAAGSAMMLDGASGAIALAFQGQLNLQATDWHVPQESKLTVEEMEAARAAWGYFAANTRSETGFVDAVAGFPSATLWDQGSYLLGLVSAVRLGIVTETELDIRVAAFLDGLARLELFHDKLPNKVYDTQTLQMTDYANTRVEGGIGWSALDMARLLMGLRVVEKHFPQHGDAIRDVIRGWDLAAMAQDGELMGFTREPEEDEEGALWQEGRIGYEQYGARAAALWGLDVIRAMSAERIVDWNRIEGVEVAADRRRAITFQAITPVLSEPYLLMAFELGLDTESAALAERVYQAQEARYDETGHITMVSEDHLDAAPFFAYSSVTANGRAWAVVAEDGSFHSDMRTMSTKAAFGWYALVGSDYADLARDAALELATDEGFPAGIYEADGAVNEVFTLNTNAVILEALHYQTAGPLWSVR